MTMNLMFNSSALDNAEANWAAITALGEHGYVAIDDATVVALAALLNGKQLVNGETVTTYDFSFSEDDGYEHVEAHVNAFGPCLLDAETLGKVRDLLAPHDRAVEMLDLIVERKLQISMSTTDLGGRSKPHVLGVNWIADEVEFNRTGSNMYRLLNMLGIPSDPNNGDGGEVDFETFEKAVNDNEAYLTGSDRRLIAFIACAKRHGATKVYWA